MTDSIEVIARMSARIHELESGLKLALETFRELYFEARPSEVSRQTWEAIRHLNRLIDVDSEEVADSPVSES